MNIKPILAAGISLSLAACGLRSFPQIMPTNTAVAPPEPQTAIPTPVLFTPSPVPTVPATQFQGPDTVVLPILLYHRIDVSLTDSPYYVSPDKFEEQMKLLHDWGYTSITTELLVRALREGAYLPAHPVLITFDDGNLNNYTTAFPIMQKYGFTGALYIVGSYLDGAEFMNTGQIREMVRAGWEVGSHGMTHTDLSTLDSQQQRYEIAESRRYLESKLGVPVLSFAYPFGVSDPTILDYTYLAGYIAGMGLGPTTNQLRYNLFSLQRRDISSKYDLKTFASFLPWQGDPLHLPTATSLPPSTQYPTNTAFPK